MKTETDKSLILSGVNALLGQVPNTLRFVSLELKEDVIHWRCVFDKHTTEEDMELLSEAATIVIADFPNYGLKEIVEIIEYPKNGKPLKNLIYYRHEHRFADK